jgi:2-polyprenyl-3-methyl-5-hydroxy-6-metoxy-1,4-benzoquinol methylase
MMDLNIQLILKKIASKNHLHSKKLEKSLAQMDSNYFEQANAFLSKYEKLLLEEKKTIDYAIECYLNMLADVNYESVQFLQTGEYSSKSFKEVNARVYANPEVMEYYMHGLLLSQFLWIHHYKILLFFDEIIHSNRTNINSYLEVGGGHGLYISEAINIINRPISFVLADISQSSLAISQKMINNSAVNYILTDIFEFNSEQKFNFITMGEVLEHVEDPVALLKKLHTLLNNNGKLFITTPTNAPAIDHIFLFRNADEIRDIINQAGFQIEEEKCIYSEDMPLEKLQKYNVSMMYAGLLSKK